MIIRATVNDNDFYDVMFGFMRTMWNFKRNNKAVSEMTPEEVSAEVDALLEHEDILKLVNPNNDKKLTAEEEQTVIKHLHKKFAEHLENACKSSDTKEYLKRHLEIKIQKSFTDKWENGEAFYWFQHSRIVVNQ